MGHDVIGLILQRMETRPAFWFATLRELTQDIDPIDPVDASMYGDLKKMTRAWLKWGITQGYRRQAAKV